MRPSDVLLLLAGNAALVLGAVHCAGPRGERGLEGEPGATPSCECPPGPVGPQGPPGHTPAFNVSIVDGDPVEIEPGETRIALAECSRGILIGGGCTWGKTPGSIFPAEDAPWTDTITWRCVGASNGPTEDTLQAHAVCLEIAP